MATPQFDLEMDQGADFDVTFHWYAGGVNRAPIEDIRLGYPTQIKVTNHGLPTVSNTPVIISDVEGLTNLNSSNLAIHEAEYVDTDWFEMPVNTTGKEWVPGTGAITWHSPQDLTNFTARCKIRPKWYSATVLAELTTENSGITLRVEDALISLHLDAAATELLDFHKAVYDVELISPGGAVTRVVKGVITMSREITYT